MNGSLPDTIEDLWRLFSAINVKIHYASEPSTGYLDITREFRTPACPPEQTECIPGPGFNATPFIVAWLRTVLEQSESRFRGSRIEGTNVFNANPDRVMTEGCYYIKIEVQGVLNQDL